MSRIVKPLTDSQIKNFKAQDRDYQKPDGRGLFIRIRVNGSKSFIFAYKKNKKLTRYTLGKYPDLSLAKARELAQEYRSLLALGVDPIEHSKEQARKLAEKPITFQEMAKYWRDRRLRLGKLKPETTLEAFRRLERHLFPIIGAVDIKTLEMQGLIAILGGRSSSIIKKLNTSIISIFQLAEDEFKVERNLFRRLNDEFYFTDPKNNPTISPDKLPDLFRALQSANIQRQTALLIEWQLLTMLRSNEAVSVEWADVDFDTPNFDKWLEFISNDSIDRKRALMAALYMILNNRHDWQLTLELIGEPGGGKSTFLNVAKLISGEGNHTAIDLELLKDEKARDIILNKSFLYSPDQERFIGGASILKKISGGDEVTFNPKNKKSFSAKVSAIIAIVSNTLPIYKNDGGGMERRRVLFPFNKAVDDKDKDDHLMDKIQNELGGIIRKLYDEFPNPNEAKAALHKQKNSKEALEMKTRNDHVLEFIAEFDLLAQPTNDCIIFGSSRGLPDYNSDLIFDRLYWVYQLFCEHYGKPDRARLKPRDLAEEMRTAFNTAGYEYKFQNRPLKGGYNRTNAVYKNRQETKEKWARD